MQKLLYFLRMILMIIISRYVPSLSDMAWYLLVGLDIDPTRFADDTWDIPERSVTKSI